MIGSVEFEILHLSKWYMKDLFYIGWMSANLRKNIPEMPKHAWIEELRKHRETAEFELALKEHFLLHLQCKRNAFYNL